MIAVAALLLYERERREQLLAIAVLAILWVGLVLTLSRSSLAALLVGLGALAALRWRAGRVLALAAAVVAIGGVAVADLTEDVRAQPGAERRLERPRRPGHRRHSHVRRSAAVGLRLGFVRA